MTRAYMRFTSLGDESCGFPGLGPDKDVRCVA